ncbi:MAG: ATPase [Nitrosomonadales bacterium]|nr:MAG: ATPase [Nitrosomonadales bacterium]
MQLAGRSKLAIPVIEELLDGLRHQQLIEIRSGGGNELAYVFGLTDLGLRQAQDFLQKNQYIGPAPVAWPDYVARMRKQALQSMLISRTRVRDVFRDFVIRPSILDQIGPAMNSGRAIFLYGHAGSGKTYLAERMMKLLHGDVDIPYSVAIDSHIIQLFDPLVHKPVPVDNEPARPKLERRSFQDQRWVRCMRPVVVSGGELALPMLDLEFDPVSKYYEAPLQLKANSGILVIDDLGRQRVSPFDLMNRWIVPLDRRVDYLTLHTGKRFEVPFDVIVVFSTNMKPTDLADDAFLRRIGYKVHVLEMTESEYTRVFEQVCAEFDIPFSKASVQELINEFHMPRKVPLLACYPRDLVRQVRDIAAYEEMAPALSRGLMEKAWFNYFSDFT